jgi:hypothetical protein
VLFLRFLFALLSRSRLSFSLALLFIFVLMDPGDGIAQTTSETYSQKYTDSYPTLQFATAPDLFAMGGGTVALRGRSGALDVNPAAIGIDGIVSTGVNVSSETVIGTRLGPYVSMASPFVIAKRGPWAGALQVERFYYGPFDIRDDNGEVVTTLNLAQWSVKGFVAYDLSRTWTVGGSLGYAQDNSAMVRVDEVDRSLLLDLGVLGAWTATTGSGIRFQPSFGASLMNFGTNSEVSTRPYRADTPTTLRAGTALGIASSATWERRRIFEFTAHASLSKQLAGRDVTRSTDGVEIDVYGPFEALTRSWGPSFPRSTTFGVTPEEISTWGQIVKHVGAEVSLYEIAALRIGRRQVADRFQTVPLTTVGGGLDLVYLRVDYAQTLGSPIGFYGDFSFLRVTAQIPLDGSYENNWW